MHPFLRNNCIYLQKNLTEGFMHLTRIVNYQLNALSETIS